MSPARLLLSHAIDYAGLFPPAGLDLQTTVAHYARYRSSPECWALGRLVLPASALETFAATHLDHATNWPLVILLGPDPQASLHLAAQLGLTIDVVEGNAERPEEVATLRRLLPTDATAFIEVPWTPDPTELIVALAAAGLSAKIRTGALTPAAIPLSCEVARFLAACVQHHVPCKATAGLHHAIRGIHPLSYEPASETALMHGFVNVLLAATLLAAGADSATAVSLLEDNASANFHFRDGAVTWRNHSFTSAQIVHARQHTITSFGSCSFTEPIAEMKEMRWLL